MTSSPLISICVVSARPAMLEACLDSLRRQERPPAFEVLVGAVAINRTLLECVDRTFPGATVCEIGSALPGEARNQVVEHARGELLLFLDDDVVAPPDLLRTLADTAAAHPGVAVFGGPNTTPPNSSRFETIQGAVLSSLVGAGPVSRRYGARVGGIVDERWFTLCNLVIRRRAMLPFAVGLLCAEENALLGELHERGERMLYVPSLRVHHRRRPDWRSFCAQMQKYGRGRGSLARRKPASLRLAHLVPSGLLAYLAALPIAWLAGAQALATSAPLLLYVALVVLSSARIATTLRSAAAAPLAAVLTATLHACYAVGLLRGLLGSAGRRDPHTAGVPSAAPSRTR